VNGGRIITYKKKSWGEKLRGGKNLPKILDFDPKFPCGKALQKLGAKPGDSVVLAPGTEVDELMRKVPEGKLITINSICEKLAKRHGAKYCCTLTTGIFIMTAAHAAEEAKARGESSITPYWRTVKEGGFLNEKYPGGAEAQKRALEAEGHKILKKGKFFVDGFEKSLVP
jgi:hypothetical protein